MTLRAGIGVAEITPEKPMFLVGYPHVERTSTGANDPLLASALALTDGKRQVLMIALDILFINPRTARELRALISEKTGVPGNAVFISCTHTHSGPITMPMLAFEHDPVVPEVDNEYMAHFKNRIVKAAIEACGNMRDAKLAWTNVKVDGVGCNRHDPNGARDPEVGVLAVKDANTGELIAMSMTYCMHPTVMHEDSKLISGDFPAYARMSLNEKFGKQLVVLYHTGPEGNQSPRYHVKGQTFAEAERLGRILGDSVAESVDALEDSAFRDDVTVDYELKAVSLPLRSMPKVADAEENLKKCVEEFERLKRENAGHGPVRTAECAVFGAEESLFLSKCQEKGRLSEFMKDYESVDLQVLRIGDVCLAGIPGEVFVEFGLEIKKRSSLKTHVVCLVNGELQGYVVTAEAVQAGGYEATNAVFSHESGKILVDISLDLISELERRK